jgi:Lon protease-like protein
MAGDGAEEFLLPIFPLPNLVFFPNTRLPLHIFEPRYRQMVADVLEADQRIGIVLLRPGWEADYYGVPAVHTCGTVGLIEQSVALEDGRYNLLLQGQNRFRILQEVSSSPYRVARVVRQSDILPEPPEAHIYRESLAELSRQYLRYLPGQIPVPEIEMVSLDSLTNALVMSLNFEIEVKQRLLEMDDVTERSEEVATELKSRIEGLQFLAPFRRDGDPTRN